MFSQASQGALVLANCPRLCIVSESIKSLPAALNIRSLLASQVVLSQFSCLQRQHRSASGLQPKAEGGEELQLRELTATVDALRKEVEAGRAADEKSAAQIQEMRVELGSLKT